MNILGISGQDRDAAAALVRDGKLIAAIEEEKLARIKHIGMTYAGGLPYHSIRFCLESAGLTFKDIDYIAYYLEPRKLFKRSMALKPAETDRRRDRSSLESLPDSSVDSLNTLRQMLYTRKLAEAEIDGHGQFKVVNHQLAHAASVFYPSGMDRAAIIVAGNAGDMTSMALMTGSGTSIETLAEAQYPNSPGMVYSAVTEALGLGQGNEHITMWLAPTGVNAFRDLFEDLIRIGPDGLPIVNLEYFNTPLTGKPELSDRFFDIAGRPRQKDDPLTGHHRNIAASLQARFEEVLCQVASLHREKTGEENLCLAGGVALNSLAAAAIEQKAGFKRVFIQPAAGNAGCAPGAALYLWHSELGNPERAYRMDNVFLGPRFSEDEIKGVLDNCKIEYQYFLTEDKLVNELADLLAHDQIAARFHGAMEFGPRTLGARSILASPRSELMRDNLNIYIKHREEFRPFPAAIPEEYASEFFEPSSLTDFLQGACRVREGKADMIPAAIFGNGMARVQTVSRKTNAGFWRLLNRFGEVTGVPVLLNTSFNLFGEPVVSTPREAVRGFYCSGIDCLALGNFLIKK